MDTFGTPSWYHLTLSWLHLTSSWLHLTPSWCCLTPSCHHLTLSWHHLTPSCHHLTPSWHHMTHYLHHFTHFWLHWIPDCLTPSWHHMAPSGHNLTPSWKHLLESIWHHYKFKTVLKSNYWLGSYSNTKKGNCILVGFGILPYPVFPGLFYNIIIILITTPLTDDLPLKSINVQTLTVIARIVGFEYKNCLIVNCWSKLFSFWHYKIAQWGLAEGQMWQKME